MTAATVRAGFLARFRNRGYLGYSGLAIAACLLVIVVVPIGIVALTSLRTSVVGTPGTWTTGNYKTVLADPTALHLLLNTVIYALGSASLALVLATIFAWTVTRASIPYRRVLRFLPLLSLAEPNLLKDIAWIQLYTPRSGLANIGLDRLFHTHATFFNIYSMAGLIIVTGIYIVPVPYLILLAPFESLDSSFEEASVVVGASRFRTYLSINARILLPALASAFALALIIVAGTFEAVELIGLPAGITTYMSAIYQSLTTSPPNFTVASAQSVWYLSLTFLILWGYLRATRREKQFVTVTGRSQRKPTRVPRWVAGVLVGVLLLDFTLAFILPVALGVVTLFVPIYQLQAGHLHGVWNLNIIRSVLSQPTNQNAIKSSLEVACLVSVLAVAVGAALSFVALKTRVRGRRLAELIGTMPLAIPGMVFSVTILITFIAVAPLKPFYNTLVPLICVDILVALPFTVRILSTALIQIDDDMLSASAASGAGAIRTATRVLLPLLRSAIVNALVIGFVVAFREIGAILLIVPTNHNFLAPLDWDYWSLGLFNSVAVLNIVTLVVPLCVASLAFGALGATRAVRFHLSQHPRGRDLVAEAGA